MTFTRRDRPLPAQQLQSVALRDKHAWHVRQRPGPHAAHWAHRPDASTAARPAGGSRCYREPAMAALEGVLFLTKEPLSSRKLSQLANLADGTEARTLIRRLNSFYDELGTAFRVEEVAGGFQLLTRLTFAGWLRRLHQSQVEVRLSAPALETLAVVAYRQPVLRVEIEAIRGVQCGEMLRQLMSRELVKIVGRGDELGRPYLYGTTRSFLQLFGLRDLDDLPRAEQLRHSGIVSGPHATSPPVDGIESVDESHEEFDVKRANNAIAAREDKTNETAVVALDDDLPEDDEGEEYEYDDDEDDEYEDDEEDDDDEYEEDEELEDEDDEWEEVEDDDLEEDEVEEDDEEDDDDWEDDDWDDDDEWEEED